MPALSLAPAFSFLAAFGRVAPPAPLRTLLRTTGYKLRPPRPLPHAPAVRSARDAVLASGAAGPHQVAAILRERRNGPVPTIVLGGFVPDATEQVFLLRGSLLRSGSVYYVNYPRHGFSADLLFAQLDDLVNELARVEGTPPVVFSVSFGAGLALEWLRRNRAAGRELPLAGLVFVSPIGCVEDLVAPGEAKPATLLGRAIKPCLDAGDGDIPGSVIEKARAIFARMFGAGAQNKAALMALMTPDELRRLHASVTDTIARIDPRGACERVTALRGLGFPAACEAGGPAPLSEAPALVLFAEAEDAVIDSRSPARAALTARCTRFFPNGSCLTLSNPGGSPVQHASLIFHSGNFAPPIARFYRELKTRKFLQAA